MNAEKRLELDRQARLTTEGILHLTRWLLLELGPEAWRQAAMTLEAFIRREPLRSSPTFANDRQIIGAFIGDLLQAARDAGSSDPEPTEEELDEWDRWLEDVNKAQRRREAERLGLR